MTVLTGYATFLLARHVTGGTSRRGSAGLLFAWSPILVTRGGAHFSLVAAAPLAVFLLLLLRAAERQRMRDAVALGATCWWAASTDAYYAVYCVIIAAAFMLGRVMTIQRQPQRPRGPCGAVDARRPALLCRGPRPVDGSQRRLAAHHPGPRDEHAEPVHADAGADVARLYPVCVAISCESRACRRRRRTARVFALGSAAAIVAAVMLSPVLYAVGVSIAEGRMGSETDVLAEQPARRRRSWRSCCRTRITALAPSSIREWLTGARPDALLRERRVADVGCADRHVRRMAHEDGGCPGSGQGLLSSSDSGARAFRPRAGCKHPHPRPVGFPPLCPDRRSRPNARAIQHRRHARGGNALTCGALLARSAMAGATAGDASGRRALVLRAAAGAAACSIPRRFRASTDTSPRRPRTCASWSCPSAYATARRASAISRPERSSSRPRTESPSSAATCRAYRVAASRTCVATRWSMRSSG